MLTTVVLIVVMLLLSAFFSGMEIAFTSKNRPSGDRPQLDDDDQIAIFARHPGQYITTILGHRTGCLMAMSLLLRSIYASLGWEQIAFYGSVAVDTAFSTVIIIFFAEFLPKSIFRNNPNFYYRARWRIYSLHRPLSGGAFHDAAFPRHSAPSGPPRRGAEHHSEFRPRGPCGAARHEQPGAAFGTGQRAETLPERAGFRRPARQGLHGSACGRRGRGFDDTSIEQLRRVSSTRNIRVSSSQQVDRLPRAGATSISSICCSIRRGPGRSPDVDDGRRQFRARGPRLCS